MTASWFKPVPALIALVGALGAVTAVAVAPRASQSLPPQQMVREAVDVRVDTFDAPERYVQTDRVQRGDTLGSLIARAGAIDNEFLQFAAGNTTARKVLHLKPGRTISMELDGTDRLIRSFSYRISGLEDDGRPVRNGRRVVIQRQGNALVAHEEDAPVERLVASRAVQIRSTLAAAVAAGELPGTVATQLADVFSPSLEIDKDLRPGDSLRVVYETLRDTDSYDAPVPGRVLAAELVAAGQRHEAVWFERSAKPVAVKSVNSKPAGTKAAGKPGRHDTRPAATVQAPKGEYYDFSGRSIKKTFLRNPLEFAQMTSGFSPNRLHPIWGDGRAHKGVDFAAPIGTRIRSVADGTIEFIGQQRGYGNLIVVRHNATLTTLYAHMSEFADGLTTGSKVSQGETIGKVGMTGWATGPHLHYEFRVGDDVVDPMTVALPQAQPLDPVDVPRFTELATAYHAQIRRFDELQIARFQ